MQCTIRREILTVIFLTVIWGCRDRGPSFSQEDINRIAHKWVPDTRVGLCNITLASGKKSLVIRGETMFPGAREEIIALAVKSGKEIIDSIHVLPDTGVISKYHGLIALSVANIRRQPAHESELVSQAILGTPVIVLKAEMGWYFVQTPDHYLGWVEDSSVELQGRGEWSAWQRSKRFIYLDNTGWIYASPEEKTVVADIVGGAVVEQTGILGDWIRVALPGGESGFLHKNQGSDYLQWKTGIQSTPEGLIRIARSFMGIPYLWGGTTAKAADCSGFMQSVFFRNGVILPRDASQQCMQGSKVDITNGLDSLEPGDLLFFGAVDKETVRVSHVALYLGDTEFIHASGRVMIGSLDPTRKNYDESRRKSMVAARRITGIPDKNGIMTISTHAWY
jgi:gamma-D-glutamyl-L-lysine dipeptidyl-peptidase